MKKEDLIKKIQDNIPDGAEVVIFDHRKNLSEDDGSGEGSSSGIYRDFEVASFTEEEIKDGSIPFSILSFDNVDYDDDGGCLI